MANTSQYKVETLVMALLSVRAGLAGVSIVHFDSDTDASVNRIVVQAIRGNQMKDGPGGYEYSVRINPIAAKGSAATWEDWQREIEIAMNTQYTLPLHATIAAAYDGIFKEFGDPPTQERSAERTTTDNLHDSAMVFAIRAVEV